MHQNEPSINAPDDRLFSPNPAQRALARDLYARVRNLPLICPHGHVNPLMLADDTYRWGTPVDVFIIPDHYIFRLLYSQGISLAALGIPRRGGDRTYADIETDHRKIWRTVCAHWHLFRATPTGIWLRDELRDVFGVEQKISSATADAIYDALQEKLDRPDFRPRRLFERFNIEVLATTDAATDTLDHHNAIRASGWSGRVIPTFRPDAVVNIDTEGWRANIDRLSAVSGVDVRDYASFTRALEQRREFFKAQGATATDHAAQSAYTEQLETAEAAALFDRALN
ncbi:MAG: glucuronate isomerase, partial [Anaerolineae bacterium]|nr:glucuronate isomerase [Anaerolineae bacterium]